MSSFVASLSKGLFWDVDPETVDEVEHRSFIIQRVLERGEFDDMQKTFLHYTMPVIVKTLHMCDMIEEETLSRRKTIYTLKSDD